MATGGPQPNSSAEPAARAAEPCAQRRIDDTVVMVTGGGGGIGSAIAQVCAAAGAAVAIVDVNEAGAKAAAAQAGGGARAYAADITSRETVHEVVAQVQREFGRIDVLVNNAGLAPVTALLDIDIDDWRRTFAVNVDGPLLMTQAVAKLMLAQPAHPQLATRGKIVNISSAASQNGRPLLAAYGATKAALNHLSKTTSAVLAPHDIATTVVYPGNVMEGMWKTVAPAFAAAEGRSADEVAAERAAMTPLGRFQRPEETAAIVLYAIATPGLRLDRQVIWAEAHAAPL